METPIQTIWSNFISDKTCEAKVKLCDLRFLQLLSSLDLINYSANNGLTVIFVALSPEHFSEKNRLIHRKKNNELEIRINLDYEAFKAADETKSLEILAETYLTAVDHFLNKRTDFQTDKFRNDLLKIFKEAGIMNVG